MRPKELHRLKEKGKRMSVRIIAPDMSNTPYTAIVGSTSNAAYNHFVTVRFEPNGTIVARCTCPWAAHGGIACSHVMAALTRLAEKKQRTLSFWPTHEDAARQKHAMFSLTDNTSGEKIWVTSRRAS